MHRLRRRVGIRAVAQSTVPRGTSRALAPRKVFSNLKLSTPPASLQTLLHNVGTNASYSSSASTASAPLTASSLKNELNTLREAVSAAPTSADAISVWDATMATLVPRMAPDHGKKLAGMYDSAMAVAVKNRQFEFVHHLQQQITSRRVNPSIKLEPFVPSPYAYMYSVRATVFEYLEKSLDVYTLRSMLEGLPLQAQERHILRIAETETNPPGRRSPLEQQHFHAYLETTITDILDKYDNVKEGVKSSDKFAPVHEALRVFADNHFSFRDMVKVMAERKVPTIDYESFLPLLQAARGPDITRVLDQMSKNKRLVSKLTDYQLVMVWKQALQSLGATVNDIRENSLQSDYVLSTSDLKEMRELTKSVDEKMRKIQVVNKIPIIDQLPSLDETPSRQLLPHVIDLYSNILQAFAAVGLEKELLDNAREFTSVFSRLEMSWAPSKLRQQKVLLSAMDYLLYLPLHFLSSLETYDMDADVIRQTSPHLQKLEVGLQKLEKQVESMDKETSASKDQEQKAMSYLAANQTRLDAAYSKKAKQLELQRQWTQLDHVEASIRSLLLDTYGDNMDNRLLLDVASMQRLKKIATVYGKQLAASQTPYSTLLTCRIYTMLQKYIDVDEFANVTLKEELDSTSRIRLMDLFRHGLTAASYSLRLADCAVLVHMKRQIVHLMVSNTMLHQNEYAVMIHSSQAMHDVSTACALLQEMHNKGAAPNKHIFHEIFIGLLKHLEWKDSKEVVDNDTIIGQKHIKLLLSSSGDNIQRLLADVSTSVEEEQETMQHGVKPEELESVADGLEFNEELAKELNDPILSIVRKLQQKVGRSDVQVETNVGLEAPETVSDLVTFIQDWYNLYPSAQPSAKTVVPILAYLLKKNELFELRRFVTVLEGMENGLSPATQLWLENRLDRVGTTINDLPTE